MTKRNDPPVELPDKWARQRVTVVVPCYNEAETLPVLVERLLALPLPELRILVVDDNSPDGTGQVADELAATVERVSVVHRERKEGLGRAYVAGFSAALETSPDWVVQMDADGSHPPEAIPGLLGTALAARAEVVIGSRYVPGGRVDEEWGTNRRWLSAFAEWYVERILGLGIRDATAGFKCWSAETLRRLDLSRVGAAGYAFQVEMNYLAVRENCRMVEVPIYFADRTVGESKMSFRVKLESAVQPWKLRRRHRKTTVD
ncbi:polyprenol monophosphomannose synthase [Amycolatopsis anabasis]|uniref:polyprenol monophosphomannose synthase n=1 Tax=Amycolatopsis anabasis TaxID=1840409 RepID=UPI00131B7547|nr:polyprenol monophosphomannose synthase [Amycolatopsis anabasis]